MEIQGGATDAKERLALQQSKYGLGDRRTLDQAIIFSGVDTRRHSILSNRCGNIDYVPFKEHPFGPEYVPSYDSVNEIFLGPRDPGSVYYNSSSITEQNMWQDAVTKRLLSQLDRLQDLKGRAESEKVITSTETAGHKISGVAHIVHVSFGDGHGLHSQHEPDGSLVMVLLVALIGIFLNVIFRRKGKLSGILNEDTLYIKTV